MTRDELANQRILARLAWGVGLLVVALFLVGETLSLINGTLLDEKIYEYGLMLTTLTMLTTGVLVASRRPRNPIGWIFLAAALGWVIGGVTVEVATYNLETSPGALDRLLTLLLWMDAWDWIPGLLIPVSLGILLFPTGKPPSSRWHPFVWLVAVLSILMIVLLAVNPGPLPAKDWRPYPVVENPLGIDRLGGVIDTILRNVERPVVAIMLIGSVISIFSRLRGATDVERQQIKWFAYVAAFVLLGGVIDLTISGMGEFTQADVSIGLLIMIFGLAALPVAVGIAILRHNLFDIDHVINRTLVYGLLTVLLASGFAGSVVLFQLMLSPFTRGNDLAVAGSTLLVAALFRPIRDRLQRFVDRRFYRQKYDAQRTLQTFSVTARDAVDLDQLTGELTAVVAMTMQPEHVSIWLRHGVSKELRP